MDIIKVFGANWLVSGSICRKMRYAQNLYQCNRVLPP